MKLLFFCIFSNFYFLSTAQIIQKTICADDELHNLIKEISPTYEKLVAQKNLVLNEYITKLLKGKSHPTFHKNTNINSDSLFVIPVVIHVVYPAGEPYGTGTNITYAQIRSQIEALNAAFSMNYPSYNGQLHPSYAQDSRIRFCLARNATDNSLWAEGPGGTEFGVKRYADNSGAYNNQITVSSANQLLNITNPHSNNFPFSKYLNIWLVKTIGGGNNIMGYAPRPINSIFPIDGVVMRADVFGDNTTGGNYPLNSFGLNQGKILAHEVGHYLNLYHIFQGGCAGSNPSGAITDACDLNGDFICDIEPATTQNIFCSTPIPNTCTANYSAGTTTLDMINDYMSYADDDCMNTFTLDQVKRMWATLNIERQTLWQADNLVATGIIGLNGCIPPYLNANIYVKEPVFCVGKPITFYNTTVGNTATTYQWTLLGGNISSSNANSVTTTYNIAGNFKAILKVSDGINVRTDSLLFTIIECKLDSSLLHMSHWYFGNYGSIDFSYGTAIQTNTAFVNHTIQSESSYASQTPYIQATISLSDSLGNLLFYSNAVSVWNRNHQKISTLPIFGASDINASTGFCYVPYPGQTKKYFVVGASANLFTQPEGVKFALVDLDNNSVQQFQSFQHVAVPNKMSQFITIVPHCNGKDYWIIAHGYDTDARFYSYLVTSAGINNLQLPVISEGTHRAYQGSGNQLKSNRAGDKLVLCTPHGINNAAAAIYDFDSRTGQVKNEQIVPNVSDYSNIQSGSAFSPNGKYFYLMRSSNFATNGLPYWLFQYRVSDLQYNVINAPGFYFAAPFQPGPDNQIYVSTQDHYFAKISNPDSWGNVTVNGSFINMRSLNDSILTGVSIPSFIDAVKPIPTKPEFKYIAVDCNTFKFSSLCYDNYTATWDFGDGSPTQIGSVVTHQYLLQGNYNVTLKLSQGSTIIGTITKTISLLTPFANIIGPQSICANGNFSSQYFATSLPDVNYAWTSINGNISGSNNFHFVDVVWDPSLTNGIVKLTLTKENCSVSDTKAVSISKGPNFIWNLQDSVCIYDSSFLLSALPTGGIFSGQGVTNNRFYPSLVGVGNFDITYSYSNEITCLGEIQKTLKVRKCNIPINPNSDCDEVLKSIQIAPNPVTESLQLKSQYNLKYVQIYNFVGQKIMQGQLINNKISLLGLAAGEYIVIVYCENNESYKTFRFSKKL